MARAGRSAGIRRAAMTDLGADLPHRVSHSGGALPAPRETLVCSWTTLPLCRRQPGAGRAPPGPSDGSCTSTGWRSPTATLKKQTLPRSRALLRHEEERRTGCRVPHPIDRAAGDRSRRDFPSCTGCALGLDRLQIVFRGERSRGGDLFPFSAITRAITYSRRERNPMIKASDIGKGTFVLINNQPHVCVEREYVNPGQGLRVRAPAPEERQDRRGPAPDQQGPGQHGGSVRRVPRRAVPVRGRRELPFHGHPHLRSVHHRRGGRGGKARLPEGRGDLPGRLLGIDGPWTSSCPPRWSSRCPRRRGQKRATR